MCRLWLPADKGDFFMKLKTVAFGAAAAGLVAAEAVKLYKQVMDRGDRPTRPMTRLMEMKDKAD